MVHGPARNGAWQKQRKSKEGCGVNPAVGDAIAGGVHVVIMGYRQVSS